MSTRIKVFNYVMSAPVDEAGKTLDEARALLASRKGNERRIAASAGAKAAHTALKNAKPKQAAKTAPKKPNGQPKPATPAPAAEEATV